MWLTGGLDYKHPTMVIDFKGRHYLKSVFLYAVSWRMGETYIKVTGKRTDL